MSLTSFLKVIRAQRMLRTLTSISPTLNSCSSGIYPRQFHTSLDCKRKKDKDNTGKIYTRTGDKGSTSLYTGERRLKSDPIFSALGATDELSSQLALAIEFALLEKHPYTENLERAQCILQDISSMIATPKSSAREAHMKNIGISHRHSEEVEEWIDEFSKDLEPLTNFILPGGGLPSAALHVARTVCRRAERLVEPLVRSGEVDKEALIYLNRLSDFLFTIARLACVLDKRDEVIYIRPSVPKLDPTDPRGDLPDGRKG